MTRIKLVTSGIQANVKQFESREEALGHEHDAYAHERAATMASIVSELLSAVDHSDVVTDVETGQLLVASSAMHEPVSDHHHTAHWIREEACRER